MSNYNIFEDTLKDNNLIIDGKKTIKDKMFIQAHLISKDDERCPNCDSNEIIKYGTTSRQVKEKVIVGYKTVINLTIQKYKCKFCGTIFREQTSLIASKETIGFHAKILMLQMLREETTITSIANDFDVSKQFVYNLFLEHVNIKRHEMPEVLCIDEFNFSKGDVNKYVVVLYDPVNAVIIDIIDDRKIKTLEDYFYRIDPNELKNVKYFVSDMYETYRSVKKKFFFNATHVVDAFHYTRYVTDALNSIRIQSQNSFDKGSKEYRLFKDNWKIFLKSLNKLDDNLKYNCVTKQKTSISDIINTAFKLSENFDKAYHLKEAFFTDYEAVKFENAKEFIDNIIALYKASELEPFKDVAKTFNNWYIEIINSFIRFGDRRLNNAYIEGMNNRIKTLKRLFYGSSNFYYFRNRLMYIINPNEPLSIVNKKMILKNHRRKK